MAFPVKNGVRYNGAPTSQPQVTHVTLIHQFVDAVLIPQAKRAGLTPVIYEDGVHDPVDYRPHLVGDQTWHTYSETWFGMSMAGAADCNILPAGREYAFLMGLRPALRAWGIGYHWETNHLHIDVGRYANDGARWYPVDWAGKPTWATSGVIPVTGAFDAATVRALQRFLNRKRGAGLVEDGREGPLTVKALQRWVGSYVDGDRGPSTNAAVGSKLGSRYPLGTGWVNTLLQIRLNSTNTGCPWGQLPN